MGTLSLIASLLSAYRLNGWGVNGGVIGTRFVVRVTRAPIMTEFIR